MTLKPWKERVSEARTSREEAQKALESTQKQRSLINSLIYESYMYRSSIWEAEHG